MYMRDLKVEGWGGGRRRRKPRKTQKQAATLIAFLKPIQINQQRVETAWSRCLSKTSVSNII